MQLFTLRYLEKPSQMRVWPVIFATLLTDLPLVMGFMALL
jgi:hypothetical protein